MSDFSTYSMDQLHEMNHTVNTQLKELDDEKKNQQKQLRILQKSIDDCVAQSNKLNAEIKRRKDIEDLESFIHTDNISSITGFATLTPDELLIITKNMDKTDYRKYGATFPRFYDLERICKEVIELKQKYITWTLKGLKRGGQYDTMPPQTFYRYIYKDDNGFYFTIGGLLVDID